MGAETAPWTGHLSWRASAASGCLYWALSSDENPEKEIEHKGRIERKANDF